MFIYTHTCVHKRWNSTWQETQKATVVSPHPWFCFPCFHLLPVANYGLEADDPPSDVLSEGQ